MVINSLKNKKILITCGPTWVPIDKIRVISNISSGQLGQTLAVKLSQRKAKVTLLEGPTEKLFQSKSVRIIKFKFYEELFSIFKRELKKKYDIIIHAAAVADYQLIKQIPFKLNSHFKKLTLNLKPTQKIITQIKKMNPNLFLVGFKLETTTDRKLLLKKALGLIKEADCDLVIANTLSANKYRGYIINHKKQFLSQANSRSQMAQKLITTLNRIFLSYKK